MGRVKKKSIQPCMSVMLNMRKQRIVPIRPELTPKGLLGYVHADLGEARADWAWGLVHLATSTE